jgi:hypothetical protein
MGSTRRKFLKQTAALSAGCLVGFEGQQSALAAIVPPAAGDAGEQPEGWYSRPMRWAQLSFVEDDPGNYDLQFWLDYFKKIHADATFIPRRFPCTIAASGLAIGMRLATLPGAAGLSA